MKPKNIILAGYPKSGTVWATQLIAQLLEAPAKGFWGHPGKSIVSEGLDRISTYTVFQAHQLYSELFEVSNDVYKVIYIVRDPRDVLLSGKEHFDFYSESLDVLLRPFPFKIRAKLRITFYLTKWKLRRMENMLISGDSRIPHCQHSWKEHVYSYLDKDMLLIRYEDLLSDTYQVCSSILSFLNCKIDEQHVLQTIEDHSFNNRKKLWDEKGELLKKRHLRSGSSGQWITDLNQSTIFNLENELGDLLQRLGYKNVEQHATIDNKIPVKTYD